MPLQYSKLITISHECIQLNPAEVIVSDTTALYSFRALQVFTDQVSFAKKIPQSSFVEVGLLVTGVLTRQ